MVSHGQTATKGQPVMADIAIKNSRGYYVDKLIWWGILVFLVSNMFSTAIVQTTVILLGVLWVTTLAKTRGVKFVRTPFDIPYLLFIAARLISIPFSVNLDASLETLNKEIIFYVIFFVITQNFPIHDKQKTRIAVWVIVGCAIVAAIIGTSKFVLQLSERAESTVSGPATLGMYLSAVLCVIMVIGKNKEYFPNRLLWLAISFVIMIGIVCTLNRVHWVIMSVIVLTIGVIRERRLLLAMCVALLIGGTLLPAVTERVVRSFQGLQMFTTGRDVIWSGAWTMIGERPLVGFGPRTFHTIFPFFDKVPDKKVGSWHNDYLQMYMESGMLGLLSFLGLMVAVFWYGWRARSRLKSDPLYGDLATGILLAMLVFYLTGLVGGFVIDPLSSLLYRFFLALLGLMYVIGGSKRSEVTPDQPATS